VPARRLREVILAEPYRLFFPLAAVLGALGVGHWILFWQGWLHGYHGQAHALAQSQSFLMAFVVGFLMTMLPRRLSAAPARPAEVAACIAGLIGTAVFGFLGQWLLSQACALAVLGVLMVFGARRRRAAPGRRLPDAFVLLGAGLLFGVIGGILVGLQQLGAPPWTSAVGRGLVQEAQFLALILGAGHLVLPILGGHIPPGDGEDSARGRRARLAHAGIALAIAAGVVVERLAPGDWAWVRAGLLLRAAAFLGDSFICMHAFRLPIVPGLHRRIAWLAYWLVPAGLLLAAAFPERRVAALHVTFIGGFALLSFAVAAHVIVSHGGFSRIVAGRPWAVWAFGSLFLLSMATRVSADFLPKSYMAHLGWASVAWMIALLLWAAFLVPKALSIRSGGGGGGH